MGTTRPSRSGMVSVVGPTRRSLPPRARARSGVPATCARHLLALVVAAAALGSCTCATEVRDACLGVDCPVRTVCRSTGGAGTCVPIVEPADGGTDAGTFEALQLALGGRHSCARLANGSVRCWGNNALYELGDGTTISRLSPTEVLGLSDAVELVAGGYHNCARSSDGAVRCWARNDDGKLGDGSTEPRPSPTEVPGLSDVVELEAGGYHVCARMSDGTVRCWGRNDIGQLGDGTTIPRTTPTEVPGLNDVAELAAGIDHTCARLGDGTVRCWGNNAYGEVGDGTPVFTRPSPTEVSGLTGVVELAAPVMGQHTCAALSDGTVRCWGRNDAGQLGDGTNTGRTTPTEVPGLVGVVELAAGTDYTCARLGDGTVRCWGANDGGQLGDGTTTPHWRPAEVPALSGVVELDAGEYHTCARLSDDAVVCWGLNDLGELGDGTSGNFRASPLDVLGF